MNYFIAITLFSISEQYKFICRFTSNFCVNNEQHFLLDILIHYLRK